MLHFQLAEPARLRTGTLGEHELSAGLYLYVGSARRGIAARVARHKRLARTKTGTTHWHIDCLLAHRRCRITGIDVFPGTEECALSLRIARREGVTAPIRGFGATDCRAGCQAHLYKIG